MIPARRRRGPDRRIAAAFVRGGAIFLIIMGILVFATFVASQDAAAGPVPKNGPRLSGVGAPDGTLLVAWYDSHLGGGSEFLERGATLQTDVLHITVYNPGITTRNATIEMEFLWEVPKTVTIEEVVNGTVTTRTETQWETKTQQSFAVDAQPRRIVDTELQLPSHYGARLTISYANWTAYEVTHDTSILSVPLPRQTLQEDWVEKAQIVAATIGCLLLALGLARWAYKRAGAPPRDMGLVVAAATALVMLFAAAWFYWREALVLEGVVPLFAGYTLLAAFITLQFMGHPGDRLQLIRLYATMEATNPKARPWVVTVPVDQHDYGTDADRTSRDLRVDEETWSGWFFRLFGARTYIRMPDDREWQFEVDIKNEQGLRRIYFLDADMPPLERPSLYFENAAAARIPGGIAAFALLAGVLGLGFGASLAWGKPLSILMLVAGVVAGGFALVAAGLRFRRVGVTLVPIAPWAQGETTLKVLSSMMTQEEVEKKYQELLVRNAWLEAKQKAGTIDRARAVLDKIFQVAHAARLGQPIPEAAEEHREMKQRTEAPMRLPEAVPAAPAAAAGNGNGAGGEKRED